MTTQKEPKWVNEARQHIGTTEIKGLKHNPKIVEYWKLIKRSGIKDDETPWCFTGDTQILTENGWVEFKSLRDELVYQSDDFGNLSLTECEKVMKDYDGDSYEINHRSVKLTCDHRHRWWGRWGKSKKLSFDNLSNLKVDGLSIPSVASSRKGLELTDNQLTLMAAFICDGKNRYSNGKTCEEPWSIEFEVSKKRKIEALTTLNPDHVYTQAKVYGKLTKTPLTVFRFLYPKFFNSYFYGYKQLSRGFINGLSKEQAATFLKAYAIFDGNGHGESCILYTNNETTQNDLVEICVLAGLHPTIQVRENQGLSGCTMYIISFSFLKKMRHIRKVHVEKGKYSGLMYCVRVPNGRIVVRGKNSAPVVTGNCAGFVGAMLELSGVVSSRYESAKSYLTWGVGLTEPVYGCIAVLTREGGGHVGFVVGKSENGNLLLLGGNQGDTVSIREFPSARVTAYRWPAGLPIPTAKLQIGSAPLSTGEA